MTLNTKNICRVCLKKRKRTVSINDKHKDQTISVLFFQLSGFCITADEPQVLCVGCRFELIQCFKFIQKCKNTQGQLMGSVSLTEPQLASNQKQIEVYYEEIIQPDPQLENALPEQNYNFYNDTENFPLNNFDCFDDENEYEEITIEEQKPVEHAFNILRDNDLLYQEQLLVPFPLIMGAIEPSESLVTDQNCDSDEELCESEDLDDVDSTEVDFKRNNLSSPPQKKISCHLCKESSRLFTAEGLNGHIKHVHKIKKQCPFCDKQCRSKYIEQHKTRCKFNKKFKPKLKSDKENSCKISNKRNVACDICGNKFMTPAALITHKQRLHSAMRYPKRFSNNNKYQECRKLKLTTQKTNKKKQKDAMKKRKINKTCPVCEKWFPTGQGRTLHIMYKHPKYRLKSRSYADKNRL